jgi:hypothetical protein
MVLRYYSPEGSDMTTNEVEAAALALDAVSRAKLAELLLRSLDDGSEEEIARLWAEEALKRDEELDSGNATARDAEDVFRDARARLS